jgi:hypothetical protein
MSSSSGYEETPEDIEWKKSARHRPGKPLTFKATIPIGQGKKETVHIRATEAGARFLKENLSYYARMCRSDVRAIRQSILWEVLELWEGEHTKRRLMMGLIKDGLIEYGPWIEAFSDRVSRRSTGVTRADGVLLDRILAAAQQAGLERKKFYSPSGRLLKGPLRAYLIELCLGGGYWWAKVNLKPPFEKAKVERGVSLNRSYGDGRGDATLYKGYLGPQWKTLMTGPSTSVPPPVRRLLTK